MSLRPEVSGFDLNELRALFGVGEPELVVGLQEFYMSFWGVDDEAALETAFAHIRHVVDGEVETGGVEDEPFVLVMIAMAHFEQEHLRTNSNNWKSYFIDYALDMQDHATEPTDRTEWRRVNELLSFLLGRPMFGRTLDTEWNSYGYLSHEEVCQLLEYFDEFPVLETDSYGFGKDLRSWLTRIRDAGKDLWFFSQ